MGTRHYDDASRKRQRDAVIEQLEAGYTMTRACEIVKLPWVTYQRWRTADPEFKKASDDAYDRGSDRFTDEVRRRAVEGTDRPVYYKGEQVGSIREFSDTLLMFELKKRRPEYRDHVNVQHSGGLDITKLVADLDKKEPKT